MSFQREPRLRMTGLDTLPPSESQLYGRQRSILVQQRCQLLCACFCWSNHTHSAEVTVGLSSRAMGWVSRNN
jgi:hypothetical protein